MTMKKMMLALSAAAVCLSFPAVAQPQAPLVKEVVTGMPKGDQQEIKVLLGSLKPGDKTPFHTHQYPVTGYVLEGTFTLELEGRPPVVKKAGEAFIEPPNVKMTGFNRGTEQTKIVIFYVSGPGEPFLHVAQ
jgi:quercetin dioxygenase-like cupin family protein